MTTLKFRRGTASQWTSADPVLAAGEPGFEIDTGKIKLGDGTANWSELPYFISEAAVNELVSASGGVITYFEEDFSRCTLGVQPDDTTTAYNTTIGDSGDVGGNVTLTTVVDELFGGLCAQFTNPVVNSSTFGFLGEPITAPESGVLLFERFYKIDTLPSFRMSILLFKDSLIGGTHIGSFAIGGSASSFKFVLVNVDTNSTVSTNSVPVDEWFRARIKLDTIAHTQEASLFLGSNLFGVNPDEVISAPVGSTPLGFFEDGMLTNPNVTVKVNISRPRVTSAPKAASVPSSNVVVLNADDTDPVNPLPNALYVRKTA